jgi:phage baseplate assembly protein gpV
VVEWVGSPFSLNPGVQLTGDGLYQISVGPVSFNTNVTVQRLVMASHINGSGDLTISSNLTWTAGSMGGGGRTLIVPSAMLSLPNPFNVTLDTRILENAGTMLWTGAGGMLLANTTRITNRPGALIEFRSAVNFGTSGGGTRSFDNAGLVRKTNSTGTLNFGTVPFNNYGSFELETGTVTSSSPFNSYGTLTLWPGTINQFAAGGSASGTIYAPSGAVVDWIGSPFALNAGVQLNGDGLYQISTGTASINTDVTVQRLIMANSISGSGNLTISSNLTWTGGTMGGGGRTLIVPSATLTMANPFNVALDTRVLENAGTVLWTGGGGMVLANTTIITNRPGALFEFRNAVNFGTSGGGTRSFDNAGILRKTTSSGAVNFGTLPFNNYGTLDIRNGIVTVNGGFTASGSSLLNCVLGGTTAGTGYGQLQKSATINLSGALSVELLPGFVPAANDAFTVVSAGTRSGTFSSFTYPDNRVALTLTNTPSSVILTVTNVFPVPQPVMLTPQLVGSNALLSWTAISNVTYRLERIGEVATTNWTSVAGDVTTTSNTASKLDPLSPSNQLYRVRVLP